MCCFLINGQLQQKITVKSCHESDRGKFVLLTLILTPIQWDFHLLKELDCEPHYQRKFSSHHPLDPSGLRPKHAMVHIFSNFRVFQIGDLTVCLTAKDKDRVGKQCGKPRSSLKVPQLALWAIPRINSTFCCYTHSFTLCFFEKVHTSPELYPQPINDIVHAIVVASSTIFLY